MIKTFISLEVYMLPNNNKPIGSRSTLGGLTGREAIETYSNKT